MTPKEGETWEHYKTKGRYKIIDLGTLQSHVDSLDMKQCVIYKALSDNKIWVRPLEDFTETLTLENKKISRFKKVL